MKVELFLFKKKVKTKEYLLSSIDRIEDIEVLIDWRHEGRAIQLIQVNSEQR